MGMEAHDGSYSGAEERRDSEELKSATLIGAVPEWTYPHGGATFSSIKHIGNNATNSVSRFSH